jgi:hypothetical protein
MGWVSWGKVLMPLTVCHKANLPIMMEALNMGGMVMINKIIDKCTCGQGKQYLVLGEMGRFWRQGKSLANDVNFKNCKVLDILEAWEKEDGQEPDQ